MYFVRIWRWAQKGQFLAFLLSCRQFTADLVGMRLFVISIESHLLHRICTWDISSMFTDDSRCAKYLIVRYLYLFGWLSCQNLDIISSSTDNNRRAKYLIFSCKDKSKPLLNTQSFIPNPAYLSSSKWKNHKHEENIVTFVDALRDSGRNFTLYQYWITAPFVACKFKWFDAANRRQFGKYEN